MKKEELLQNWKILFCDKSEYIDPSNELHWESLFIGMAIAYNFTIDEAKEYYDEAWQLEGTI